MAGKEQLTAESWNRRYLDANTPWDLGDVSPPLKQWIDRFPSKELKILIPGAGKAHEATYLFESGFQQVFVCDWAEEAMAHFREQSPDFPESQLLVRDFFELAPAYDIILEQTFFCALHPSQRPDYARKCAELLVEGGLLGGLLFAHPFPFEGPPFGGTKEEYLTYLEPHFEVLEMEVSPHSVKPRAGRELFFLCKSGAS
jgi:SAM-dependent methyltransferase